MTLVQELEESAFRPGTVAVVKVGGRAFEQPVDRARLAGALARLVEGGVRIVVVHGGGAQVTNALKDRGVQAQFVGGLRVTTPELLAVAEPVFTLLGKEFAHALTAAGAQAIGMTGRDGDVVTAKVKDEALGRVGTVTGVDANLLRHLAFNGVTPVVGPVASDGEGGVLNVNADEVAGAVAQALGARSLVLLTDIEAVLDGAGRPVPVLTAGGARELIRTGAASGGMVPKLQGALAALAGGVKRVHVVSGQRAGALETLAAGEPVGTAVVGGA